MTSRSLVTLDGVSGAQFKGYLVATRRADRSSKENIGTFGLDRNGNSKVLCVEPLGNALTHNENSLKSSAVFDWTAPATPEGDVVIHYTVVRGDPDYKDYFQDLRSDVITGPPPVVTSVVQFARDPDCGVSKGCYSDCDNGNCAWEVSWQESEDVYNISLKTVFDGSDNKYVALGFSTNSAMAQASVVACVTSSGTVQVAGSFNPGYANTPLTEPSTGLSNQITSYENGILSCKFSRAKTSSDPQVFNLTEPWYIITARGTTTGGGVLMIHDSASRFHTDVKIDLTLQTTDESFAKKHTTVTHPTKTTSTTDVGRK